MQTTLSIDDDIAALLDEEVRRSSEPLRTVINRLLRLGLVQTGQGQTATRFKVKPQALGLPKGQSYDCIAALLEELEGPEHR